MVCPLRKGKETAWLEDGVVWRGSGGRRGGGGMRCGRLRGSRIMEDEYVREEVCCQNRPVLGTSARTGQHHAQTRADERTRTLEIMFI